jgi:hypothetical protein
VEAIYDARRSRRGLAGIEWEALFGGEGRGRRGPMGFGKVSSARVRWGTVGQATFYLARHSVARTARHGRRRVDGLGAVHSC